MWILYYLLSFEQFAYSTILKNKTDNNNRMNFLLNEFLTSTCNSIVSYDGSIKYTSSTYHFSTSDVIPFKEFIEESIAPIEVTLQDN
jgi:hypothetical protein